MTQSPPAQPARRRAVALIIAVSLLSVTNLIVTGVIAASGDDAYIGKLRLDSIAAVQAKDDGLPGRVDVAHLVAANAQGKKYELLEYREPSQVDVNPVILTEELEDEMARAMTARHDLGDGETTLLACLDLQGDADLEDRRRELEELARTAGLRVLEVMEQKRSRPDPRTLLGKGKINELVLASKQLGVDLIVFDRELAGNQMRNIAELTDLKVIDRTQLRFPAPRCARIADNSLASSSKTYQIAREWSAISEGNFEIRQAVCDSVVRIPPY